MRARRQCFFMALTLKHLGAQRRMWLFDTFEGLPAPTEGRSRLRNRRSFYRKLFRRIG